jgi:hypothetical protein
MDGIGEGMDGAGMAMSSSVECVGISSNISRGCCCWTGRAKGLAWSETVGPTGVLKAKVKIRWSLFFDYGGWVGLDLLIERHRFLYNDESHKV